MLNTIRGQFMRIQEAMVIPFDPPAIQGLGTFGGFAYELQQTSGGSLDELEGVVQQIIAKANTRPELAHPLFTSFTARDPQFVVEIDRQKAKSLNVPFSQITSALQIYMGSQYVNDFDFNNRSYRVMVQADQQFRSQPRDLRQFYVRSDDGRMISLDNLVTVKEGTNASVINHYNLFRSVEIDGSAAPGYSSGQAIQAMEEISKEVLHQGYSFEWTGISLEEIQSGAQTVMLFGLGLLVVYLTLSAQYESFVCRSLFCWPYPWRCWARCWTPWARGLQNDVYCQIGLVMLIGLASKNAILIVEFAEQLQHRGMGLVESAIEAARLRLRPILMTSIAFILGVLPLVFASGAGAAGRHSVGTTVFGGMIVSTFLNLFIIPVLYILVRGWLPMKLRPNRWPRRNWWKRARERSSAGEKTSQTANAGVDLAGGKPAVVHGGPRLFVTTFPDIRNRMGDADWSGFAWIIGGIVVGALALVCFAVEWIRRPGRAGGAHQQKGAKSK